MECLKGSQGHHPLAVAETRQGDTVSTAGIISIMGLTSTPDGVVTPSSPSMATMAPVLTPTPQSLPLLKTCRAHHPCPLT